MSTQISSLTRDNVHKIAALPFSPQSEDGSENLDFSNGRHLELSNSQGVIPSMLHRRARRMVPEEPASTSAIPEQFRNLGMGEVREWIHPQTGEALKVVQILNENNRIVAVKLKSQTKNTYVEVNWQSGVASKKIIYKDSGVYLKIAREEGKKFSRLERPLFEMPSYFPKWDPNISIGREEILLNQLVGEGKLYREGPTGFLIRKGRKGEFVYRAHKGPSIREMPRSHGVGHWSDTFGDGSGDGVIAAGSTIHLAQLYRREFIKDHGEHPSNVRLYMIDVEGLDVAYADESIALNFNVPKEMDAAEFADRKTDGWGGVAPTEVHIRGPIPKGRVTDITNFVLTGGGNFSGTSLSTVSTGDSLGYTYAGKFIGSSDSTSESSTDNFSDRRQQNIEPVAVPQGQDTKRPNRFVAKPKKFLSSLQSTVKNEIHSIVTRIPSGTSIGEAKISQTIYYMPSIHINSVASSDFWNERLLSLAEDKIRSENLPIAEFQRFDSEYFYAFYHPSTKKLVLSPKADMAYDFNSLLRNGDLLEKAHQMIMKQPRDTDAPFSDFLNNMTQNGRVDIIPRAVVIVVPEEELKTNNNNRFRQEVENLRQKHPTSEVYALSLAENEQWRQWKFEPGIREGVKNWIPQESPLQGKYDKIILFSHGQGEQEPQYGAAVKGFAAFVRDVKEIDCLNIVLGRIQQKFGIMLYQKFAETGVAVPYMMGSEQLVDGNLTVWQMERLENGELKTTLFPTPRDGRVLMAAPEYADPTERMDPFKYAEQLQQVDKEKQRLETFFNDYKNLEVEARRISNKSDDSNWVLTEIKEGSREVTLLKAPQEKITLRLIDTEQSEIDRIARYHQEQMGHLKSFKGANKLGKSGSKILAIAAWISFLSNPEAIKKMPVGLQIDAYWNLADILGDLTQDGLLSASASIQTAGRVRNAVGTAEVFIEKLRLKTKGVEITQKMIHDFLAKGLGKAAAALTKISIAAGVGSVLFNLRELSLAQDEKSRIQAGISLGTSVAALGLSVTAGPLSALSVVALGMLINYIMEISEKYKYNATHAWDVLLEIEASLKKGFEIKEGQLNLGSFRLKELDMRNGRALLASPLIQTYQKRLRQDSGSALPENEKYHYSAQKELLPLLSSSPSIEIYKNNPQKILTWILPAHTKERKLKVHDGSVIHHLNSQQLAMQNKLKAAGVISGLIVSLEEEEGENVPFNIKLDEKVNRFLIPPQAGKNEANYIFETSMEGGGMIDITNLHPVAQVTLKDMPAVKQASIFRVHIPNVDPSVKGVIKVDLRGDKKFLIIKNKDGKTSEIDISQIQKSYLQLVTIEEVKEGAGIKRKIINWNIDVENNEISLGEGSQFMGYTKGSSEIIHLLKNLNRSGFIKSNRVVHFSPSLPHLPILSIEENSGTGTATSLTITKKVITTLETKTTIVNKMSSAYGVVQEYPSEITTLATPANDPQRKILEERQTAYVSAVQQAEENKISTIFDPLSNEIIMDPIYPDAQAITGTNAPASFFFKPETGIVRHIKSLAANKMGERPEKQESTYELPIRHPESILQQPRDGGNQISFEQKIPYGEEGKKATVFYEAKGNRPQIKKVSGLSWRQIQQLKPRNLESARQYLEKYLRERENREPFGEGERSIRLFYGGHLLEAMIKVENGRRVKTEINSVINFSEALTNILGQDAMIQPDGIPQSSVKEERAASGILFEGSDAQGKPVRQYIHPKTGHVISLGETDELVAEVSEGGNRALVFHSPERKTAFIVKLLASGRLKIENSIENIVKVMSNKSLIYFISENGKKMVMHDISQNKETTVHFEVREEIGTSAQEILTRAPITRIQPTQISETEQARATQELHYVSPPLAA